ncbi:MAG: glycosyltransferase family 39 protein [Bacteroidales bacterium]|nr:glycosyltransferase family 39 protein [Bacteroidales bacterium]
MANSKMFWALMIVCVFTLMPFLDYEYNTKGEPRESIVSYSMLTTHNWVLPRNNGGEMAYKPPFFHWCVAAVSALNGKVTETTSRIPSAVALISVVMITFVFYARRKSPMVAILAALICLLSMELHRAGGNCRVDMLLTALSVGAICLFYRWYEQGCRRPPFWAIVLMSLATLTKGPIGFLIPCATTGTFLLLKRTNFFVAFGKLFVCGLLALIPYAIWFYAAYQQGGQEFIDLMYEENIGRMTNTMAYQSCVEPWWFSTLTLTYGFIPFTLLLVFGLFSIDHLWTRLSEWKDIRVHRLTAWITDSSDIDLFSLASALVILVFYSIPDCKRSVYLMPMYPFVAYFMARFMLWLGKQGKKSVSVYASFLATVGMLLFCVFMMVRTDVVPENLFQGKHAPENIAALHNLASVEKVWEWLLVVLPTMVSVGWWWFRGRLSGVGRLFYSFLIVLTIYVAVDGVYKPAVLNGKSVRTIAAELRTRCPASEGGMYEYIEKSVYSKGDPLHYFELNFFLDNTIGNFHKERPDKGFLLIGADDMQLRQTDFESQGYRFVEVFGTTRHLAGQPFRVYRFQKTSPSTLIGAN